MSVIYESSVRFLKLFKFVKLWSIFPGNNQYSDYVSDSINHTIIKKKKKKIQHSLLIQCCQCAFQMASARTMKTSQESGVITSKIYFVVSFWKKIIFVILITQMVCPFTLSIFIKKLISWFTKSGYLLLLPKCAWVEIRMVPASPGLLLTHLERRPQNIYSQEEMNLYCIIKLAIEISLFSLQISKTGYFG